jgi:hypothetical protein
MSEMTTKIMEESLGKTILVRLRGGKKLRGISPLHMEKFLSVKFLLFPYGGDVTFVYGRF